VPIQDQEKGHVRSGEMVRELPTLDRTARGPSQTEVLTHPTWRNSLAHRGRHVMPGPNLPFWGRILAPKPPDHVASLNLAPPDSWEPDARTREGCNAT
jgi:hypothetical protein